MSNTIDISNWKDLLLRRGVESTLNHFLRTYRIRNENEVFYFENANGSSPKVAKYTYGYNTVTRTPFIENVLARQHSASSTFKLNPPFERDHFFEVQHIVTLMALMGNVSHDAWAGFSIPSLLTLSYYVNDSRNLFQIAKTFNRGKAHIQIDAYAANSSLVGANEIDNYLHGYFIGTGETVCQVVWGWATEMNALPAQDNYELTQAVGSWLCAILETHFTAKGVSEEFLKEMKAYKIKDRETLDFQNSLKDLEKVINAAADNEVKAMDSLE